MRESAAMRCVDDGGFAHVQLYIDVTGAVSDKSLFYEWAKACELVDRIYENALLKEGNHARVRDQQDQ